MRYVNRLRRRSETRKRTVFFPLLSGLVFFSLLVFFVNHLAALKKLVRPITVFSKIMGAEKLNSNDNRTNVLIFGLDRRGSTGTGLSDTIIVVSLDLKKYGADIFSVPRDVWVKKQRTKVNVLYALGGIDLSREAVSSILGIPIHYYAVIDFAGFERAINAVSGIEVRVDRDFEDLRYPISGKENDDCGGNDSEFSCRYEHLIFKSGNQKMNGDLALKYARSRQSSGPEGSDFARGLRQQKVILAFKDKVLSLKTLINPTTLPKLYGEFNSSLETNISFFELQRFYELSQKMKPERIISHVVNTDNYDHELFYNPTDYSEFDGQWVLLPKTSDFSEVHSFVQKALFGDR